MSDSLPQTFEKALDLTQLRAQTGGDRGLEREVLGLFLKKSAADLARITTATPGRVRREAAHGLVGSARAIGAGAVARLAALVEHGEDADPATMAALGDAITTVQGLIRRHLEHSDTTIGKTAPQG